jgi:hypothetical protein
MELAVWPTKSCTPIAGVPFLFLKNAQMKKECLFE